MNANTVEATIDRLPPKAAKMVAVDSSRRPESLADDVLESCLYVPARKAARVVSADTDSRPYGPSCGVSRLIRVTAMTSETRFQYLPAMSDHDLTNTYVYACAVIGHGPEPWVVRALSDWLSAGRAELARRGLLARTKCAKGAMRNDHHARKEAAAGY